MRGGLALDLVTILPIDYLRGSLQRGLHRGALAEHNACVHLGAGVHAVQQANLQRVHVELTCEIVHLRFVDEGGLWRTKTPERARDGIVRVHSDFLDLQVLHLVWTANEFTELVQHFMRGVRVRTGIGDCSGFYRDELAFFCCGSGVLNNDRMTLDVRQHGFPTCTNEMHGALGGMREKPGMNLYVRLILGPEGAADVRCDHTHHALRHSQRARYLHPVPMRCLAGGINRDPTFIVNETNAPFRLQKSMFSPLRPIRILDDDVGGCDRGINVACPVHLTHHDVVFARYNLGSARLHGFKRIKYPRQLLIFHFNCRQCCISCGLVNSRHRSNGVPLKTNFVDNQQRLVGFGIQVTVLSGNIGVRDHGEDAGQFSRFADVELLNASPRIRAVQQFAAEQTRQANIRAIQSLPGYDILSTRGDGPLADDR